MPDLNHSSKFKLGFFALQRLERAHGKRLVTFGARKTEESLPFLIEFVEQ